MAKIDTTLSTLEGDLSANLTTAGRNLAAWANELSESSDSKLKAIGKDLQTLKKHLGNGKPDGKAIGELLGKLGRATLEVAPKASKTTQQKLERLGHLLNQAAGKLS